MKKTIVIVVILAVVVVATVGILVLLSIQNPASPTPSVTINGTKYWVLNTTLTENLAPIKFSGVTFNFSYPCNLAISRGACPGVTFTTVPCSSGVGELCGGSLPVVQIVFHDGTSEYFNNATVNSSGVVTYDSSKTPNHYYLTSHSGSTVAIEWVTNQGHPDTLLLLVNAVG